MIGFDSYVYVFHMDTAHGESVCVWVPEEVKSPATGITVGCEQLHVGSETQTQSSASIATAFSH